MLLVYLIIAAMPPFMAYRGILFRGAWAAVLAVSVLLAAVFGSVASDFAQTGNRLLWLADLHASAFAALAFGALLAVCLYRSPLKIKQQS